MIFSHIPENDMGRIQLGEEEEKNKKMKAEMEYDLKAFMNFFKEFNSKSDQVKRTFMDLYKSLLSFSPDLLNVLRFFGLDQQYNLFRE